MKLTSTKAILKKALESLQRGLRHGSLMPNICALRRVRSFRLRALLALSMALLGACSGESVRATTSSGSDHSSGADAREGYAAPTLPPLELGATPGQTSYDFSDDEVSGDRVEPSGEMVHARPAAMAVSEASAPRGGWFANKPEPVAANTPPAPAPDFAPALVEPKAQVATDAAPAGPVLVYSASFLLSVYEVQKAQTELKQATAKLGGFVSSQNDNAMTLRVPANRFEQAVSVIEATGKVRARNVQALDVGEQYRDLDIRLRTAEAVRTRLEAMLQRAEKVEEALKVEAELGRVIQEIERLKGQLRALGDRIAFSTLTVEFRPESRPDLDDSEVFRLPYLWLDELGLHQLLELAP